MSRGTRSTPAARPSEARRPTRPARPAQPSQPARPWQPLPTGSFTGTVWSAPGATTGQDPYLAWAEADHFSGYALDHDHHGKAGKVAKPGQPKWLPIAIELSAGASVPALVAASSTGWLQIPKLYLNVPGLRFCTARVKPKFFAKLRSDASLASLIARYELGLPVGHHTQALHHPCTPGCPPVTAPGQLRGKVLGLIDGGLAFANRAFLSAQGKARTQHFWRQDETQNGDWPGRQPRHPEPLDPARAGPRPPDTGYGHELSGQAIDQAMARFTPPGGQLDEDALYKHLQLWDLGFAVNHGTHVMSLAASPFNLADAAGAGDAPPDWGPLNDDASRCDLVAVQLDWPSIKDTSGGGLNVSVLDGLMYILARCAPSAKLVVNISWGTLAGPHDGTSVLEAAMDQLIDLLGGRLQITVPAGNAYQSRTHANATLRKGEPLHLHWRVQPDDHTQSFLEIWLPEGADQVDISVTPPGQQQPLPTLRMGQSGMWLGEAPAGHPPQPQPLCALIYPPATALGKHGTCALLALAPTFSLDGSQATAPFGRWQVTLSNRAAKAVVLDAYIERDDVALGRHTGARQSYFEDASYNTSGNVGSFVDQPANPTPIRRSGTFNSLSTGQYTVSVGGTRHLPSATQPFALYSPQKPDPDASRAQRPGVKKVPDTLRPSDDTVALWGVLGAGSRSGSVVRLAGTSSSAPQQAREMLNNA